MQQSATSAPPAASAARAYPKIQTPLPGPKAKAIVDRDRAFTSHAYLKEYPLAIARGQGVMVEDVDGNRFLDFMSGIAVSSTGYGHPKVIAAVQEAAAKFLHICGSDFYFEGMAALSERLARLAPGKTPKRVFLTNSGTEATEGRDQARAPRHAPHRDYRVQGRVSWTYHRCAGAHVEQGAAALRIRAATA